MSQILKIDNLKKYFPLRKGLIATLLGGGKAYFRAVDDISFAVDNGEILGFVGESGCGKSTMSRTILQLLEPTGGRIYFKGTRVDTLSRKQFKSFRRKMQMIFQDPYESLNPRFTVYRTVCEPLEIHGIGSRTEKNIKSAAQQLSDDTGTQTMGMAFDASDSQSIDRWISATIDHFGGIDCLVVNAGGPPVGHFDDFDDQALNILNKKTND